MSDYNTYLSYILSSLNGLKKGLIFTENTDLVTEAGLSSLQVMELIEKIEDHFDMSIPLNILPDINTAGDLARQLEKLH
jgi:acyl carrier protein